MSEKSQELLKQSEIELQQALTGFTESALGLFAALDTLIANSY